MMDKVSTNKTDFFREPAHFDFLNQHVFPKYAKANGTFRPLKIWSSACSSGEEVYSIAITIEEYNQRHCAFNYSIAGTDISNEILKKAINGVYPHGAIKDIPLHLREKYFLRSKDRSLEKVRIVPKIRQKTAFSRLNLMRPYYGEDQKYDVIFCRNVMIYFNKKTQEEVLKKQCSTLRKGGYFFLGHSESITGMKAPLKQVYPTIYQKL
ncbi:MAG: CheR family methyltransferase [Cytophagales bacterium]|nr:CheR family methyltransferase [Cytophagales bacterium]